MTKNFSKRFLSSWWGGLFSFGVLTTFGCGEAPPIVLGDTEPGPADAPADDEPSDLQTDPDLERHDRFIGTWLVSQPTHGAYEETWYEFKADGTIERLSAYPEEFQTGSAGVLDGTHPDCDYEQRVYCPALFNCFFGDEWSSVENKFLDIEGICDDGETRTIRLAFVGPRSSNAEWAEVEIVAVGEHTEGLRHFGWEWAFTKCFEGDGSPVAEEQWMCASPWGP